MANEETVYTKQMVSIQFGEDTEPYEVVDAKARQDLTGVENEVAGIPNIYATKQELAGKQDAGNYVTADSLATVATTGEYSDLVNAPTIPVVDSVLDSTSTNAIENQAVYNALQDKQDTLVGTQTTGQNIKTINGDSVLGSGNLVVQADLPSQTGNEGKFLTTNGTTASWATVPGGSSAMPVFEPTTITTTKSIDQVIQDGLNNSNSISGIAFNGYNPDMFLANGVSSCTFTNNDLTIAIYPTTVSITVGKTTENIYENNSWTADKTITDSESNTKVVFDSSKCQIEFFDKTTDEILYISMSDLITVSELKKLTNYIHFIWGYSYWTHVSQQERAENIDFSSTPIYSLYADNLSSPADLIKTGGSSWTLSNSNFTFEATSTDLSLTAGSSTAYLCQDGNWILQPDYVYLGDKGDSFYISYNVGYNENAGYFFNIEFRTIDSEGDNFSGQDLSGSTTTYIDNLDFGIALQTEKSNNIYTTISLIGNAHCYYNSITFDSVYANNFNTPFVLGATRDAGYISVGNIEATVTYNGTTSVLYSNDAWTEDTTLSNGCTWDLQTHTLTLPSSLMMQITEDVNGNIYSITDNIVFGTGSSTSFELPDPALYTSQIARIKDTYNDVDLLIYSDGSKWDFTSYPLILSSEQRDNITYNEGMFYGINCYNKFCVGKENMIDGLWGEYINLYQLTRSYDNGTGVYTYYWNMSNLQRRHGMDWVWPSNDEKPLNSFTTYYYSVSSQDPVSFNINSDIFDTTVIVDVSDVTPNISFSASTLLLKQDGVQVSAFDFSTTDTVYKITFNGNSGIIVAECESFAKNFQGV